MKQRKLQIEMVQVESFRTSHETEALLREVGNTAAFLLPVSTKPVQLRHQLLHVGGMEAGGPPSTQSMSGDVRAQMARNRLTNAMPARVRRPVFSTAQRSRDPEEITPRRRWRFAPQSTKPFRLACRRVLGTCWCRREES